LVSICVRNPLKREILNLEEGAATAPQEERNLTQHHTEAAAMHKEDC
jgi:hypothetical protein